MNRRRGVSLVELLLVMSAAVLILTMSAGLIHRLMHAQSKARSFVDVERTLLRLGTAFRSDVHQASGAVVGDAEASDGIFLRLSLPESQTIEYRCEPGAILRTLRDGSQTASREEFAFPPGIELTIQKEDPRLVVLSLHSRPGELTDDDGLARPSAYAVPVNLHLKATLGREALFTAAIPAPRRSP